MIDIQEAYQNIPKSTLSSEIVGPGISLYQHDSFFRLGFEKDRRAKHLSSFFNQRKPRKICFNKALSKLRPRCTEIEVDPLEDDFLKVESAFSIEEKIERLDGCIAILNNSAMDGSFLHLFNSCQNTLFAIWDWDNHHFLPGSSALAAHSDLYVPAHHHNNAILSRFNSRIMDPVACGVQQWSSYFIEQNIDEIIGSFRSDSPLGKHTFYPQFEYRNKVIATLIGKYPNVNFNTNNYPGMSDVDRLNEWISYKVHWIIPVLNDIPIRLFDSLITGGIPLVPDSLRCSLWLQDANPDDILFYSASDVANSDEIVRKAIELFDSGGTYGVLRRIHYALSRHHGDSRVSLIVNCLRNNYGLIL